MVYKIVVGRTSTRYVNILVEADSESEAVELAVDDAPNHDFSEGGELDDVSYDTIEITKLKWGR